MDFRYLILNIGYWLLVIDYWMMDDGRWMDTSDGIENLSIDGDDSGMGTDMGTYYCITVLLLN